MILLGDESGVHHRLKLAMFTEVKVEGEDVCILCSINSAPRHEIWRNLPLYSRRHEQKGLWQLFEIVKISTNPMSINRRINKYNIA
jgi:hypothetical protein